MRPAGANVARLRALWLTSVDSTAYATGQQSARMLLTRVEHPDAPGQTQLMPPRPRRPGGASVARYRRSPFTRVDVTSVRGEKPEMTVKVLDTVLAFTIDGLVNFFHDRCAS